MASIVWKKVWRDLAQNKARTALAVLSTAVGILALGLVFGLSGMMRDQLKNLGLHSITNAESGLLGVDLARTLDPKLIIMDHNLPDMDGLQCLQLIREDNTEVKIIICSGNLTSDTMRKYILLGANHILTKPVSTSALADAVKRLIH